MLPDMRKPKPVTPPDPPPDAPHLIGYARVSMADQDPRLQIDALLRAGVAETDIWHEKASGASTKRPALQRALKAAQPGDVLVIWKLDRLGRNTLQVLDTIKSLTERGIQVRCITQNFDTSSPMGKAMLAISAVFAELERDLIRERTLAGLKAARERGRTGGRKAIATRAQLEAARVRIAKGESVAQVARSIGYKSRTTLHKAFQREGIPLYEPE